MAIRIASRLQHAAAHPVHDLLSKCLDDSSFTQFRFMVAFARWAGIFLIDPALQRFAARPGTGVTGYVGVDLGGTTVEALTYLSELTGSKISIVEANMRGVVFHPKVYEFTGPTGWLTVVGSSNLTMGGLLSNVESVVVVTGQPKDRSPAEALFDYLAPKKPFTADHIRRVTPALLEELAPRLDHYSKPSPDARSRSGLSPGKALRDATFPNPGRPPSPASGRRPSGRGSRRHPPVSTAATTPTRREELYVELWDETRDGTQVQLPRRVFTDFFGAAVDAVTWIAVRRPGESSDLRIRLQGFPNSTFRISLPFVGHSAPGAGRRAVLRFVRLGQDQYSCDVAHLGDRRYDEWLALCTERTTNTSKRFGVRALRNIRR
jgi:HKD family nuclease